MTTSTMTNTVTVNDKKKTKVIENKVCAILHSITAVLWIITSVMAFYTTVSTGKTLGWNFWSDIAIAVVFGSIAVEYMLKYRKEKKEADFAEISVVKV